jgi:hypothetical protein
MTRWIKIGSIALVAALCVMGFSTANAQASTPAPTPSANGRAQIIRTLANALLGAAEKATNLSQTDITAEIESGKTLADILKEHNADVAAVEADAKATLTNEITQAVSAGKLTQAQADKLTPRIDQALDRLVNQQFPLTKDKRLGKLRAAGLTILIKDTADATKLSQRDLLKEIRSGKTLAQIATEHGADPSQIVSTAVTQATDRINKAVTAGKLKDDQAKTLIAALPTGLTDLMNTANPLGKGGKTGKGNPKTTPAPEGTPSL